MPLHRLSHQCPAGRYAAFLLICISLAGSAFVLAGDRPPVHPICVVFARNAPSESLINRIAKLGNPVGVNDTSIRRLLPTPVHESERANHRSFAGTLWYLTHDRGLSLRRVAFHVVGESQFEEWLVFVRKTLGEDDSFEHLGDGRYKLVRRKSATYEPPNGIHPHEHVAQALLHRSPDEPGTQSVLRVVELPERSVIEASWSTTELFRYQENVLFSSSFQGFWTLDLPSRSNLSIDDTKAISDVRLDFIPEKVLPTHKQKVWDFISAVAGTHMQQANEESSHYRNVRKALLASATEVAEALLFDVERISSRLRFEMDDDKGLLGQIHVRPRDTSGLQRSLDNLTPVRSYCAPLMDDNAAVNLHVCVHLSKQASRIFTAMSHLLDSSYLRQFERSNEISAAWAQIRNTIEGIANHRDLEFAVNLSYQKSSDGVIYGGILVHDNPLLKDSLRTVATSIRGLPVEATTIDVEVTNENISVLQLKVPQTITRWLEKESSLRITHVFVTLHNSMLWFAAGSDNAIESVKTCVARSGFRSFRYKSPLLTAKFDVDRWITYLQTDRVGVGGLLTWLDEFRPDFPPNPWSGHIQLPVVPGATPNSLIWSFLTPSDGNKATVKLRSDKSGFWADVQVNASLVNYFTTRTMEARELFMKQTSPKFSRSSAAD